MSDDWVERPLRSLLADTIGGLWGSAPGEEAVDVQVLRSTDFTATGALVVETAASRSVSSSALKRRQLRYGDILLEKSGGGPKQPVGRVASVQHEPANAICGNFIQLLRPSPEVSPRWLFHYLWLCHLRGDTLEFQAQTTGIRNLRTQDYLDRLIAVPPYREQLRIAELADQLADALCKMATEAEALRELRNSLGASLWEQVERTALASLGKSLTGRTPATGNADYWEPASVPFFAPGDLSNELAIHGANRAVSKAGAEQARLLPPFSVLQVCIGATIGKVAVLEVAGAANQQINALTGLDRVDAGYVAAALGAPQGQAEIAARANQTTLPILKKSSWMQIEVPWPTRDERENAASVLWAIHEAEEGIATSVAALSELQRAVLSELFAGNTRLASSYDRFLAKGKKAPAGEPDLVSA